MKRKFNGVEARSSKRSGPKSPKSKLNQVYEAQQTRKIEQTVSRYASNRESFDDGSFVTWSSPRPDEV
jgi:hypothetical protein